MESGVDLGTVRSSWRLSWSYLGGSDPGRNIEARFWRVCPSCCRMDGLGDDAEASQGSGGAKG